MRNVAIGVVVLGVSAGAVFFLASLSKRPGALPGQAAPVQIQPTVAGPVAGSVSCRECHEKFYELWSTSHHGLAMQPYTPAFAAAELTPQTQDTVIGKNRYRAEVGKNDGFVREVGEDGKEQRHPIVHVLGGKNVYYFLTPLEKGRLQTLPVAYDVHRKEWFDTAGSAMRHFLDRADAALDWRETPYTFNTSCYSCHVSQLSTNYELKSDTYHTTWTEPGINCETCHGPSGEHVKLFKQLPPGARPKDIKLIVTKTFTSEQHNSSCAPCHARMTPITASYTPGERYFDHYDLVTVENPDFYPDGRELGEDYTFTGWRMNPCAKSGQLNCVHCHTSSGRNRFTGEKANDACLPCHEDKVKDPASHTHHKLDSTGSKCVACHMPKTEFARMWRTDHSMRPPTPATTIAFKSPSACNLCHTDKDAAWADQAVRQWHKDDYQAPVLKLGELLLAARRQEWAKLPQMLDYLASKDREEVYATAIIRLLADCPDERKWPALVKAMQDPSPLVRSAAATELGNHPTSEALEALLAGVGDEYRLVRVRSARSLAGFGQMMIGEAYRPKVAAATAELLASLQARPDDWASHYNLGSYYYDLNDLPRALDAFKLATRLRPDVVPPLVNASMAYARLGQTKDAQEALTKALAIDPTNAAANYNLGLLDAELGDLPAAEKCLRAAVKSDPNLAAAAYNLGVLLSGNRMNEALEWCRKAAVLRPDEPKYSYTLAFFLAQAGNKEGACEVLQGIIHRQPAYADAYLLMASIREDQGRPDRAKGVYQQALEKANLSPQDRARVQNKLMELK